MSTTPTPHGATVAVPVAAHAAIDMTGLREKISIRNLEFFYGDSRALKGISLSLYANKTTAFIGPSGCGKSTLLRVLNRMYDLYPGQRATGEVMFDGGIRSGQDVMRALAHRMVDDALTYLETVREKPVWQPMPEETVEHFKTSAPHEPAGAEAAYQEFSEKIFEEKPELVARFDRALLIQLFKWLNERREGG